MSKHRKALQRHTGCAGHRRVAQRGVEPHRFRLVKREISVVTITADGQGGKSFLHPAAMKILVAWSQDPDPDASNMVGWGRE